jgi:hypothetical protein
VREERERKVMVLFSVIVFHAQAFLQVCYGDSRPADRTLYFRMGETRQLSAKAWQGDQRNENFLKRVLMHGNTFKSTCDFLQRFANQIAFLALTTLLSLK